MYYFTYLEYFFPINVMNKFRYDNCNEAIRGT